MCDTFVVVGAQGVVFGKNSDRDPNEAQRLEWLPAREHADGSTLQCTWNRIPQARRSNAVVLSRPYWMWGAEMGANEHGVAIGNAGVLARGEFEDTGLTGMDLVRLALERSDTAEAGMTVIRELLAVHGQCGRAGYARADVRHHNSFLIADRREAWILETVGRDCASRRISAGVATISNALQLPPLRSRGRRLHTLLSRATSRSLRVECLAAGIQGAADAARVLCDHGAGAPAPHFSRLTGALAAPCVHAGGWLAAAQTTGSWISELSAQGDRHWATGTSSPCLSVFRPLRIGRLQHTGTPTGQRDTQSLWWRHEKLHRAVIASGWTLPASFHADRERVQRAIFTGDSDGWTLAEDWLERWENFSAPLTSKRTPRWLTRAWNSLETEAAEPPSMSWRSPLEN